MDLSSTLSENMQSSSVEIANNISQDKSRPYLVYVHINQINNKAYVGITCHVQNPNRRWRSGKGYQGSELIMRALQKYGWDNFSHKTEIVGSKEEACRREQELIKYYKELGLSYNITNGGEGAEAMTEEIKNKLRRYTPWIKGRHHTREVREKIAAANLGRKKSEETRAKIGKHSRGRTHVMSEEAKLAISKAFSKPVYQIDKKTGEILAEYPSCTAAEIALSGHVCGHVTEVCLGKPKRHTYLGFKWRYKYE